LQPAGEGTEKGRALNIPGTEAHFAKAEIDTTFWSGQTRLIASWKPEGLSERGEEDLLQAAFLTVTWLKYDQGDEQP
jgi:hypothetical protein